MRNVKTRKAVVAVLMAACLLAGASVAFAAELGVETPLPTYTPDPSVQVSAEEERIDAGTPPQVSEPYDVVATDVIATAETPAYDVGPPVEVSTDYEAVEATPTQGTVIPLVYQDGKAYGVQVGRDAKIRESLNNSAKALISVRKNDRLIRVGNLIRGKDGNTWARIALSGGKTGFICADALLENKVPIEDISTIYVASLKKSSYLYNEYGRTYKNVTLRRGTEVALLQKMRMGNASYYLTIGQPAISGGENVYFSLLPADAVEWPDGEPKGLEEVIAVPIPME